MGGQVCKAAGSQSDGSLHKLSDGKVAGGRRQTDRQSDGGGRCGGGSSRHQVFFLENADGEQRADIEGGEGSTPSRVEPSPDPLFTASC